MDLLAFISSVSESLICYPESQRLPDLFPATRRSSRTVVKEPSSERHSGKTPEEIKSATGLKCKPFDDGAASVQKRRIYTVQSAWHFYFSQKVEIALRHITVDYF
ncbi:hypothetical protein T11_2004 [Trichinella zimbabwensis]|uniref:Uncharacterized protein n=1 Tax=Trichinella zimbabwensis TaxID=268475 RepID=A0A0V1I6H5_9BILA|nr:hypothetical protein T11_2004 [Trichinella zimbabwensis]